MEHRDELEENTVGQEVSAHVSACHLSAASQPVFHPPAVRGRRLLSAAPEGGGGAGVSGAVRPGGPGGPQCPGGAQPAPGGPHRQEILRPDRGPGRPDLHRHHRTHQGDLHL